jgi:hypothetical protein
MAVRPDGSAYMLKLLGSISALIPAPDPAPDPAPLPAPAAQAPWHAHRTHGVAMGHHDAHAWTPAPTAPPAPWAPRAPPAPTTRWPPGATHASTAYRQHAWPGPAPAAAPPPAWAPVTVLNPPADASGYVVR